MANQAQDITVGAVLRADVETVLYRGQRRSDGRNLVLKTFIGGRPSAAQVSRLRHEYSVLRSIDSPVVVRALGLEDFGDGPALVLDHVGEQPLDALVGSPPLALPVFLLTAIAMSESVEAVHRHHVIHKNIRPHNFFRDPATGAVTLIDFAAATRLAREDRCARRTERLEGTLAYMSPEQTGRMNRSLDRRTDLYSLGVALYQLLTGVLPFRSDDPLELVHSHIARVPLAPNAVRRDCPPVLSEIILRLLAKNAEDRYQDVAGLKADLLRCQRSLEDLGAVATFTLGEADFSDVLRIPQRLYGRETELAILGDSFGRACAGGAELVLVSGDSGVGKSVLVGELQKKLAVGARLVTAKFDPIGRRVPYAPIAHVCGEMLRTILAEPPAVLARWRDKLRAAVGANGRVVADIVPELALLLGEQTAVEQLAPTQAQHRFEQAFLAFLQAFATAEHPLVLFLDDLQWADVASLHILRLLLTAPQRAYLLCIGAYRENEVDAAHPLMAAVEALRAAGTSQTAIHLGPLPESAMCRLLADIFAMGRDAVAELGKLALQKTQGNPLFLEQFLRACERDRHIVFVPATRRWAFDLRAIGAATATDNVVDLMVERLRRLPPETQELLRFAACVGYEFDRRILTLLGGRATEKTRLALWPALREGLVVPVEAGQAYLHETPEAAEQAEEEEANPAYRFLHDRVHQAAYAMLDEQRRQRMHLDIGRLLRVGNPASLDDRRLFDVVNHLNLGSALMVDEAERHDLARLNLSAAVRAKDAAAHAIAVRHVETCLALLGPAAWSEAYELAFPAEICRVECHIATGQCDDALAVLDRLEQAARNEYDRASALILRILTYTNMDRLHEAIACGMRGAAILGMPFSDSEAEIGPAIGAELGAFFATLGPRPLEVLLDLPPMTERRSLLLLQMLHRTMPSATIARPTLMALIVTRAVHLCLRQGNSPLSSYFYVAWAMLQAGMGEVSKAQAIARIGMELSQRFGSKAVACANHFLMGGFVAHWTDGPTAVLEHLRLGLQNALEVGEMQYASYCSAVAAFVHFLMGRSLESVAEAMRAAQEITGRTGDVPNQTILRALQEVLALLEAPARAAPQPCDGDAARAVLDTGNRYVISSHFHFHAIERYLAGDLDGARSCLALANPTVPGAHLEPELTFLGGLLLGERVQAGGTDAPEALAGLKSAEAALARHAAITQAGFGSRHALLAALRCMAEGDDRSALTFFQQSIALARTDQAVLHEALANELAGNFAERRGWRQLADELFFRNASEAYARWGSSRKARELANRVSGPKGPGVLTFRESPPAEPWSGEVRTGNFDAIALAKATQAISSEIVLAKLMRRLMQTTIEVAGAERGVLLLSRQGEWWVECAVGLQSEEFSRCRYEPDSSALSGTLLPRAVIDFVARSREKLLLDPSSRTGRFADDPYLSASRPQSVLCLPLIRQGQLVAILYLENGLASDVFSADQVDLLEHLSTQAAISLENARLYEEMEERVRERTRQLEESLRTIRDNQAAIIEAERRAAVARLESELALARKIQTSIVPHELTAPGMEIAALMRTASEVGGDYYDLIPIADGGFWLGIGDVSGHGLSAGLGMLMLQSGLSSLGHSGAWVDPAAVLSLLNRTLYENIRRRLHQEDFITLSLFRFFANGSFRFAGAHEDILIGRARTRTWQQIPTRGTWLGVAENITAKTSSREERLEENDVMVLFTDGVIEARRQRREQFGMERVIAAAAEAWREPAAATCRRILDSVAVWSPELEDDQTVVVVRRCATRPES